METRIRDAITAIHHSQILRQLAVKMQRAPGGGNILTPLQLMRVDTNPTVRGPEWFTAAPPEGEDGVAECGVSQTIVFGKCQRVQNIDYME